MWWRTIKRLVLLLFILMSVSIIHAQTDENDFQWDGTSRYTVLLMGIDRRPTEGTSLTFRSDSIMIASIDPINKSVGILSIPRDMHFPAPNSATLVPINTFLVRGETNNPGSGAELSKQVLQDNLGIYIDAYVLFDFDAFIAFIDSLGGIEITLTYNLSDPTYPDMDYGFDPLYLAAGTHQLDGETALKFSRTRHGDNDYLRGQRQLQVVQAVRTKLSDPLTLQKMLVQGPTLWNQLEAHLYSSLNPEDALYLAIALMNIKEDQISYGALNQEYSYWYRSGGEQVRIPDRDKMVELMTSIFGENYWQG